MPCVQMTADAKRGMQQIILFSKFQEDHFPKLIGLPITKNVWNLAVLYANKPNHGKKKTEWTASRRNRMEEARGGGTGSIIYRWKMPRSLCVLWPNLTGQSLSKQNPLYLQGFDWCILRSWSQAPLSAGKKFLCILWKKLCKIDYIMNMPA